MWVFCDLFAVLALFGSFSAFLCTFCTFYIFILFTFFTSFMFCILSIYVFLNVFAGIDPRSSQLHENRSDYFFEVFELFSHFLHFFLFVLFCTFAVFHIVCGFHFLRLSVFSHFVFLNELHFLFLYHFSTIFTCHSLSIMMQFWHFFDFHMFQFSTFPEFFVAVLDFFHLFVSMKFLKIWEIFHFWQISTFSCFGASDSRSN